MAEVVILNVAVSSPVTRPDRSRGLSMTFNFSGSVHPGQSQLGCHAPNGINGYLYSPGVLDISIISLTPV
ncbi:MAG: hypothetical protein QOK09_2471 [Mycobacterium sp.]|jgi:hypothetical protein|nr:hypothetical protein [Mycobacterium sp.]